MRHLLFRLGISLFCALFLPMCVTTPNDRDDAILGHRTLFTGESRDPEKIVVLQAFDHDRDEWHTIKEVQADTVRNGGNQGYPWSTRAAVPQKSGFWRKPPSGDDDADLKPFRGSDCKVPKRVHATVRAIYRETGLPLVSLKEAGWSADGTITLRAECTKGFCARYTDEWIETNLLHPDKVGSKAIHCSLDLKSTDKVINRVVVQGSDASGITIDCNGGTLNGGKNYVRSIKNKDVSPPTWSRPKGVTIQNCRIEGAIRVAGMGDNGEAPDVVKSSHWEGHLDRVRVYAPKDITLANLKISGEGGIPVYFSPGVSDSTVRDSTFTGYSISATIYLGAETYKNTIRDNVFKTKHGDKVREHIAVDASSYNVIVNNTFYEMQRGGIYLYRNCGEGGGIRHTPPEHNAIINNYFYYKKYRGGNPAIYVGSREGEWGDYCVHDEVVFEPIKYTYTDEHGFLRTWGGLLLGTPGEDIYGHLERFTGGSQSSNLDHAQYNTVRMNQIQWISGDIDDDVRRGGTNLTSDRIVWSTRSGAGNWVMNELVAGPKTRRAGCAVQGEDGHWLDDGARFQDTHLQSISSQPGFQPTCVKQEQICDDGYLHRRLSTSCDLIVERTFSCSASTSSGGAACSGTVTCPAGMVVVASGAACDLEGGNVPSSHLFSGDVAEVIRQSDNVNEGLCDIGEIRLKSGQRALHANKGDSEFEFYCYEHDKNGGECEVRGVAYCGSWFLPPDPLR